VIYAHGIDFKRERPAKKTIILDEGEASLTIPDSLSVNSCDELRAWLTSLLGQATGRAMIRQGLANLHTSVVAHVANDDGTK